MAHQYLPTDEDISHLSQISYGKSPIFSVQERRFRFYDFRKLNNTLLRIEFRDKEVMWNIFNDRRVAIVTIRIVSCSDFQYKRNNIGDIYAINWQDILNRLKGWLGTLDTERLSIFPFMACPILIFSKTDLMREACIDYKLVQKRVARQVLELQVGNRRFALVGFISAKEKSNIQDVLKNMIADFLDRLP